MIFVPGNMLTKTPWLTTSLFHTRKASGDVRGHIWRFGADDRATFLVIASQEWHTSAKWDVFVISAVGLGWFSGVRPDEFTLVSEVRL